MTRWEISSSPPTVSLSIKTKIRKGGEDLSNNLENVYKYHAPKEGQPEKHEAIRNKAKELAYLIDEICPASRERSIAHTNLEQVSMWANASIARN